MDDLISRKALLAAYDERHKGPPGGARELIEDAPSVPAVPLDKLCEWLARSALFNTGYRVKIGASMWKELIKREVMEELYGRSD